MNRRDFIQGSGGALAALSLGKLASVTEATTSRPSAKRKTPNLLFIITDQQRKDTLSVYGNNQIKVPNLNRLAAESVVFENYYVTQPLCTPSRGSLMTGLYPHSHHSYNNNVVLPESTPVLVQLLKKKEYVSAYFGKWHLGNEICKQHGFDYWESTEDYYNKNGYSCDLKVSGYSDWLIAHGQKPDDHGKFSRDAANAMPEDLSKPAYLADIANNFMTKQKEKPWVMYVSFLDPHTPFHSVNDHLYDPKDMKLGDTYYEKPDPTYLDRQQAIRDVLIKGYGEYQGYLSSPEATKVEKARYWGKISLVDEMIGRIHKKLAELGEDDNTIIVFTSDHGEMMGDHRLMFKSVMFQQAIQVPMIVHVPWLKGKPQRVPQNASGVDVVPTLLELMSQEIPAHLQGRSWAPYFAGKEEFPERDVIIEWNGVPWPPKLMKAYSEPLRAIVTAEGWKLVLAPEGAGELFNLKQDPEEKTNLFYRKDSLETVRMLVHRIHLWQGATGDTPMPFDELAWEARRQKFIQEGVPNLG